MSSHQKGVGEKNTSAPSLLLPLLLFALMAIGSYYLLGARVHKKKHGTETHHSEAKAGEHGTTHAVADTAAHDTTAKAGGHEATKAVADTQAHASDKTAEHGAHKTAADTVSKKKAEK